MPITLATIKDKLDNRIGEELLVVAQAGRKKVTKRRGRLHMTYPAVFVVDLDQDENSFERVSYSYTDILTRNIKLNFDDETDGEEAVEDIEDEEDEAEFDAE
ncbi:Veg family protein [Pediococcus acidilactici]|uniref:Veg family protein n=1 Tax=Pediococcus acidilactici TaxID=1254 RepID=UPI0025A63066|nr:Veg family protein [Pediococcus acidilactici]MDM5041530.1 Veg family protein [Pediococcus acidilactici]